MFIDHCELKVLLRWYQSKSQQRHLKSPISGPYIRAFESDLCLSF